jgi:hypothetical protein
MKSVVNKPMNMCARVLGLALFATVVAAPAAQATPINIIPDAGLAANTAALAAFNRAATTLGSRFSDPITVNINANLGSLGAGIIGSASSTLLLGGYTTVRNLMVADAAGEADDAIVAALPTAAQFSATMPTGFGLTGNVLLSSANAKALGVDVSSIIGLSPDGTITFSSDFAFDYDNSDGVSAGLIDFETVALHELVHALGFISSVDQIDQLVGSSPVVRIDFTTLDMFRFAANNAPTNASEFTSKPRNFVPGAASGAVTSDVANAWAMSTGVTKGDGRQASHWKDDDITGIHVGIMDPTLSFGLAFGLTDADIRALDLIGWDQVDAAAVPEPASILLLGSGLVAVIRNRKRRGQTIQ